ncbi:hypothetical protein WICMUC_003644 [Wickerhamomyces mucosus]|uniref:Carboxypeptidase n=1 Tax=Wickerhamomyces mucosus TaxID=1378264 RepID=A0A9P8PKJ1_9ASCO|nr:hypothetical protein WICMUC_003644 [Wickerhamomyces mucosus]
MGGIPQPTPNFWLQSSSSKTLVCELVFYLLATIMKFSLHLSALSYALVVLNALNLPELIAQGPLLMKNSLQSLLEYADAPTDIKNYKEILNVWEELSREFSFEYLTSKLDDFNENQFIPKAKEQLSRAKSNSAYEFVTDSRFKDYQLRTKVINPGSLGIDTVNQTSGYLDFEGHHFFYYFFESRNNPETDPVILWLNGGPGCSSLTGLFFELGPSSIGKDIKPIYNPYSWNSNASVIFLDQPVGVGYSYGDEKVSTTYAAAKDVFIFLELFYQKFPQFIKNDFHIAGESYAGHYIPAIASEIINHADRSFELTSVLIGNGITDSLVQDKYYQPMACGLGGYKKVLDDDACDKMEKDYPRCARLVEACYSSKIAFTCVPATIYCSDVLLGPYEKTGLNYYDIRSACESDNGLCYNGIDNVEQYLNLPYVQEALGSEVEKFSGCNDEVFSNFAYTGDESKPLQSYITELLDKGYPVLIYAGDKDFICNWLGNLAWTNDLDWILADSYRKEFLKPWYHNDGSVAGQIKSFGGLTFLRVFDAGHMVPYDQPEVSLKMVNTWIWGNLTTNTEH